MRILRALCYCGIMFVVGIVFSPITSGDWSAMWLAIQYFGWVAVVLALVIAATYAREK